MARTLDHMGLQVPESPTDDGAWGPIIDGDLETIDAHNHAGGAGRQVPSAGINVDAPLSFNGEQATNLAAVGLAAAGQPGSQPRRIYASAGGDLFYNNELGVAVRITQGNGLDSGQIGGIKGDYAAAEAAFFYDAAGQVYRALREDPPANVYDSVAMGDAQLFPKGTTGPVFGVQLKAPAGMSADVPLTFPAALPAGATRLLQVTTAGAVQYNSSATPVGGVRVDGDVNALAFDGEALLLREAVGDTYGVTLRAPAGFEAGAANAEIDCPQAADVFTGAVMGLASQGTWEPVVLNSGSPKTTTVTRATWYRLSGGLVMFEFLLSWSAGENNQVLGISGLPFTVLAGFTGAVFGTATGVAARDLFCRTTASTLEIIDTSGAAALTSGTAGTLQGQVWAVIDA